MAYTDKVDKVFEAQVAVVYATTADYQAAIRIARDYGEVVEPADFTDGKIDGMEPDDWAAHMFND